MATWTFGHLVCSYSGPLCWLRSKAPSSPWSPVQRGCLAWPAKGYSASRPRSQVTFHRHAICFESIIHCPPHSVPFFQPTRDKREAGGRLIDFLSEIHSTSPLTPHSTLQSGEPSLKRSQNVGWGSETSVLRTEVSNSQLVNPFPL